MQIEFTVSNLKPRHRRRPQPAAKRQAVSPAVVSLVLAYQIEDAVKEGRARDYADVARQTGLTRARISQIMRLLRLPPAFIEKLLHDNAQDGRRVTERQLRPLVTSRPSIEHSHSLGG